MVIMGVGAKLLGYNVGKFASSFTLIFIISYLSLLIGHYASIAATPNQLKAFNLTWSLNLTGEAGFIIALLAEYYITNKRDIIIPC